MGKPFLKWAGGKRQILDEIMFNLPKEISSINTYIEPFIGGGAVLFYLLDNYEFDEVHISDLNPELILCYKLLKSDAVSVASELDKIIENYPDQEKIDERKKTYYEIREQWNKSVGKIDNLTKIEKIKRVSQMIFLNRTCFNGLFRVNSKGEFNVPIGSYENPSFPSSSELLEVQKSLKNVTIHLSSFEKCLSWVKGTTFVYFDPPYRPISRTSQFISYSKNDFNDEDQKKLSNIFRKLDSKNVKILLSNSDPRNTDIDDLFFDELYQDFNILRINAKRSINSNPEKRGKITELLIKNY